MDENWTSAFIPVCMLRKALKTDFFGQRVS